MASYNNPWLYNNKEFETKDIPEGAIGFVYEIDCPDNKIYIGRKIFWSKKRKVIKGKVKKIKGFSDWENYYGSSPSLKELFLTTPKEQFKRRIVRICFSKSEMQYFESKKIFETDALLKNEFKNDWISCRINSKNLSKLPEYEKDGADTSSKSRELPEDAS